MQDTPRRLARKDVGPGKAEGTVAGHQKGNLERHSGEMKCTTLPETSFLHLKGTSFVFNSQNCFKVCMLELRENGCEVVYSLYFGPA